MTKKPLLDPPRMIAILEQFRAELEAIPREQFAKINVLRGRVLELTDLVLESFTPCVPMMKEMFSPTLISKMAERRERVSLLAQAFFAADLLATEEFGDVAANDRNLLFGRVAEHDKMLLKWAWPLFGDDEVLKKLLADIQRDTGHQDDAEDTIRLVRMFRTNWAAAAGKTPIDEAYLDQAEADATEMIAMLTSKAEQMRDLARRGFTAWRIEYREIIRVGRFLRFHEPNVLELFPGIAPDKASRSNSDGEGGATDDGDVVPEPETPPSSTPSDDGSAESV